MGSESTSGAAARMTRQSTAAEPALGLEGLAQLRSALARFDADAPARVEEIRGLVASGDPRLSKRMAASLRAAALESGAAAGVASAPVPG